MKDQGWVTRFGWSRMFAGMAGVVVLASGCTVSHNRLRYEGLVAADEGKYEVARQLLLQADEMSPQRVDNLYDIAACSIQIAKRKFKEENYAAAMRETDTALAYLDRAIQIRPAHIRSLEGKSVALRLKGRFDEALEHAQRVSQYVRPSARQYMFLARELEHSGAVDDAEIRHRQAVDIEPENPLAHKSLADFLARHEKGEAAIYHWQMAYKLDPFNREVAEQLIKRNAIPSPLRTVSKNP